MSKLAPIHPGEVVREDFLHPARLLPEQLAQRIGLPDEAIWNLLAEKAPLTADQALRLARLFATTPEFWLNLQLRYDLRKAEDALSGQLEVILPLDLSEGRG